MNNTARLYQEDTIQSLGEVLIGEAIEPVPSNIIEMDGWFDRQLRKLGDIAREQERNEAVAAAQVKEIVEWRDEENAVLENKADYIRARIQEAMLGYDFGDKKSRRLPHGEFGRKKIPAKLIVDNPELVLSLAGTALPEEVRRVKTTIEVDKNVLNEVWASTGMDIIGTHVEPESEKVIIKPKADK